MYELSSQYNLAILLPLFIVSVLFSIYFYRTCTLSSVKKYFFISLKSLAIFLFFFLFLQPVLIALISDRRDEQNLVLIDNSRSNLLNQNSDYLKKDVILKILKSEFNDDQFKFIPFSSGEVTELSQYEFDSLGFNGYVTNLSQTLVNLRNLYPDNNYNSIFILSDGLFNEGGSPIRELNYFDIPVFVIPIGDTLQKRDAVVMNILHNEKAFIETPVKIKIDISAYGLKNENLIVRLYQGKDEINSRTIMATEISESFVVDFEFKSNKLGLQKFRISVDKADGEITYANNHRDFYIEFLDNKIKLLYISAAPSSDNSIFIRTLRRIKNFEVVTRIQKTTTDFYEGNIEQRLFPEFSLVILNGFPSTITSQDVWNNTLSLIRQFQKPILFFSQKNTDYKKLEQLDNLIPFIPVKLSGEFITKLNIINTDDTQLKEISSELNSAPQIFSNLGQIEQKAGSETLIIDHNGNPFLIIRSENNITSASVLGYGFWRWFLNPQKSYSSMYEKFLLRLIDITNSKDKKNRFSLYPIKRFFDYTEQVTLIAEVLNDEFTPITTATIKGKILSDNKIVNDNIEFEYNNDRYSATLPSLPASDYEIIAEAENNQEFFGEEKNRFTVDTTNTEFLFTATNKKNLTEIANITEGNVISTENGEMDIDNILSKLNNSGKKKETKIRFRLWENKYYLFLMVLLFSFEWFLRKRNNIA